MLVLTSKKSTDYSRLPVVEHYDYLRRIRVPHGVFLSSKGSIRRSDGDGDDDEGSVGSSSLYDGSDVGRISPFDPRPPPGRSDAHHYSRYAPVSFSSSSHSRHLTLVSLSHAKARHAPQNARTTVEFQGCRAFHQFLRKAVMHLTCRHQYRRESSVQLGSISRHPPHRREIISRSHPRTGGHSVRSS